MTKRALYWRRKLEAIGAEGISASAYARREGWTLGLLYQWRRKLNAPADPGINREDVPSGFFALRVTESLKSLPSKVNFTFPRELDIYADRGGSEGVETQVQRC